MEINNEKLNSGIKEIRNIKMTQEEKENILHSILSSPIQKREPIKSPWMNFSFLSNRLSYMAIAICLVLIISGGTFYGSQKNKTGNISSLAKIDTQKQINLPNTPPETVDLEKNTATENTNIANPTKNPTLAILDESNKNAIQGATPIPSGNSGGIVTSSVSAPTTMMSANPSSFITIISPNGGETFNKGEKITVKWQSAYSSNIKFNLIRPDGTKLENQYINNNWNNILNTGEETFTTPNDIPRGQYKLSATVGAEIQDVSDNYFTVK